MQDKFIWYFADAKSFEETLLVEGWDQMFGMTDDTLVMVKNLMEAAKTLEYEKLTIRFLDNELRLLDYMERKGLLAL